MPGRQAHAQLQSLGTVLVGVGGGMRGNEVLLSAGSSIDCSQALAPSWRLLLHFCHAIDPRTPCRPPLPACHGLGCRHDFIASGGAGGELRVWDLASREMVAHLKHHSLAITDLKVGGCGAQQVASQEELSAQKCALCWKQAIQRCQPAAMAPCIDHPSRPLTAPVTACCRCLLMTPT